MKKKETWFDILLKVPELRMDIETAEKKIFWNDDKVIDFVNWYLKLHKLDFRYRLENRTIIESFKNGDDPSKWHCG